MNRPQLATVSFAVGLLVAALTMFCYQWRFSRVPAVAAAPAAAIANETTTAVPCTTLQAYSPATKGKLNLPPAVQSDPAQHVTAATTLASSSRPQTVTAVTNTDTGATVLYTRTERLPWFTRSSHGEIALATGFSGGKQATQLEIEQNFYQIKMLRLGVTAQMETGGRLFLGVRAAMEW